MDPVVEEKHKTIEELNHLADACWKEFDTRRSFEWKVSFGLWTAIGIILGFTLKEDINLPWWLVIPLLIFILAVYIWFHYGLRNSSKQDQDKRHAYIKVIQHQIGFFPMLDTAINDLYDKKKEIIQGASDEASETSNEKIEKEIEEEKKKTRAFFEGRTSTSKGPFIKIWSHGSQIGITFILLILLGVILVNKDLKNSKDDKQKFYSHKKIEYPFKHTHQRRF